MSKNFEYDRYVDGEEIKMLLDSTGKLFAESLIRPVWIPVKLNDGKFSIALCVVVNQGVVPVFVMTHPTLIEEVQGAINNKIQLNSSEIIQLQNEKLN